MRERTAAERMKDWDRHTPVHKTSLAQHKAKGGAVVDLDGRDAGTKAHHATGKQMEGLSHSTPEQPLPRPLPKGRGRPAVEAPMSEGADSDRGQYMGGGIVNMQAGGDPTAQRPGESITDWIGRMDAAHKAGTVDPGTPGSPGYIPPNAPLGQYTPHVDSIDKYKGSTDPSIPQWKRDGLLHPPGYRAAGGRAMYHSAESTLYQERKRHGGAAVHKEHKEHKKHDDDDDGKDGYKHGGKLTAAHRNALPTKSFAGPDRSYPIEDENHAKAALSRVSANGSPELQARVKAAVHKKYPGIGSDD